MSHCEYRIYGVTGNAEIIATTNTTFRLSYVLITNNALYSASNVVSVPSCAQYPR